MGRIEELKHRRAELIAKQRELLDKAYSDKRDNLNSDEETHYQAIEADVIAIESTIKREEDIWARTKEIESRRTDPVLPAEVQKKVSEAESKLPPTLRAHNLGTRMEYEKKVRGGSDIRLTPDQQKTVEYLDDAGERFIRFGKDAITHQEFRDLSVGGATAGATLVPTSMAASILMYERQFGVMRQISRVFQTATGDSFTLPRITAYGSSAWNTEGAAFAESDPTIGSVTFYAYKGTHIAQVSEELLQDSAFDVMGLLGQIFGQNLGVLQNNAFVSGNGTNRPTGIANNVTTGKTLASNVALTANELVDFYHSVLPPYRVNATFVTHDNTIAAMRKLVTGVSSDNTFLWQPGLQAGAPDRLFGKPILADPDVATMANSAKCMYFGDFNAGYWIRDVGSLYVQRLNELYAATGQVGFRAWQRCDGIQVDALAIKALVNNAS